MGRIILLIPLFLASAVESADLVAYAFSPKLALADHAGDSIRIQPEPGADFSAGFSVCFRIMFHYWNVNEVMSSEPVVFGFGNYTFPCGYFRIGKMWYVVK
jgi:hypothetical protein